MTPHRRTTPLNLLRSARRSAGVFGRDVAHGLLAVSHNSLALLGLGVLAGLVLVGHRADMRTLVEEEALDWLLARQEARLTAATVQPIDETPSTGVALLAVERATAADPATLDRQQHAVAQWLSRRYRVAVEPLGALVQEAWSQGRRHDLDPAVILAVMAVESSFNPFAQSPVGAQGLMQVLTRVHDEKYVAFGGTHAAFDPLTNLRVGVEVLKDCISKAGSLEAGLKHYVGAANLPDDAGYAQKVLTEARWLSDVAKGRAVPWTVKAGTSTAEADATAARPATAAAPATSRSSGGRLAGLPQRVRPSEHLALLR